MYRIRDVVEQSGLNELTETAREHLVKANIYLEKQQYKNSIEEYQQVIVDSPWVFDAFFNLAHIYAADIQYTKAIETMQNYLVFQPQGARSRQARDAIYTWGLEMTSLAKTWLEGKGISVSDIDTNNPYFYLGTTGGVIINEINQGSQALHSGLRREDIISAVNGEPVSNTKDFINTVSKHVGSLQLFINRTRYSWDASGKVEKSLLNEISYVEMHTTNGDERVRTPDNLRTINIDGVLINEIDQDSQAWQSGLRKGDIIYGAAGSLLSIRNVATSNTQDFVNKVNGFKKSFRVWYWRPRHETMMIEVNNF